MSANPWVNLPQRGAQRVAELVAAPALAPGVETAARERELAPQPAAVQAPRDGLPRRTVSPDTSVVLWWVGAHGGAGESTLQQLLEGSRAAGHAWPSAGDVAAEPSAVVLVARTSAHGLRAAQLAATQWASGSVAVRLLGLALIADAPGRLPKPLKDLAHVVAGGVPRSWRLPWVEPWRLGEPLSPQSAPQPYRSFLDELRHMTVTSRFAEGASASA